MRPATKAAKLRKVFLYGTVGFLAYQQLRKTIGRKQRKWWVRPIYKNRDQFGFYETTFQQMKNCDPEMFKKATRMSVDEFNALLNLVGFRLQKTSFRKPISIECRLALTVIYLAHGGARQVYALKFKMATCTIGKIINETCQAIWDELSPIYLSLPNQHEWHIIAKEYEEQWQFPHCIGAIDGKHVSIVCPPNGASQFFNYKGRHSVVLLAICDAKFCFTMVDIGAYGSQSDGGILSNTSFWRHLCEGKLPIPNSSLLPNSNEEFPYFFIGDSAFPLGKHLMRPFAGNNLSEKEEKFNKRLSHARVTIENTFGIMAARWRVLRNDIHAHPETVDSIIKAAVVLHNYLMLNKCGAYCPPYFCDSFENGEIVPGQWRNDPQNRLGNGIPPSRSHIAARESYILRKKLCDYIWQQ